MTASAKVIDRARFSVYLCLVSVGRGRLLPALKGIISSYSNGVVGRKDVIVTQPIVNQAVTINETQKTIRTQLIEDHPNILTSPITKIYENLGDHHKLQGLHGQPHRGTQLWCWVLADPDPPAS